MRVVKNRIVYIDMLKFVAIFAVIAIHVLGLCGSVEVLNFPIFNFRQIFEFAVPIFLMITGALFLNKPINLIVFFRKRFVRIFYPFIFFSILVFLLFNCNIVSYYWYSLMVMGTLFAIPIINKFVQNSSENEIKYYILIFILFSIIQQFFTIFKLKYAFDMIFFLTPVSYLIIGYYLFNKDIDFSHNTVLILAMFIFIVSTIIKIVYGSYFIYFNLFRTYLDLSVLQVIQASSVFIFFKFLYSEKISGIFLFFKSILNKRLIKKFILSVSRSSYGMYLIQHPLIFQIILPYFKELSLTGSQTLFLAILIIFGVFFISWIIVIILSRMPLLNKISGYN